MSVDISPVGVGCRVVGIEAVSFSFLYLVFYCTLFGLDLYGFGGRGGVISIG